MTFIYLSPRCLLVKSSRQSPPIWLFFLTWLVYMQLLTTKLLLFVFFSFDLSFGVCINGQGCECVRVHSFVCFLSFYFFIFMFKRMVLQARYSIIWSLLTEKIKYSNKIWKMWTPFKFIWVRQDVDTVFLSLFYFLIGNSNRFYSKKQDQVQEPGFTFVWKNHNVVFKYFGCIILAMILLSWRIMCPSRF